MSDVHCPISFQVKANKIQEEEEEELLNKQGKYKWDFSKKGDFVKNINAQHITEIENKLNNLLQKNPQEINLEEIQDIVKDIS